MKLNLILGCCLAFAAAVVSAADEFPSESVLRNMIRRDHPRLFITQSDLAAFKTRANTVCKETLEQFKQEIDSTPVPQSLEGYKGERADFSDGRMIVRKHVGDQDELTAYIPKTWSTSGFAAVKCAILYHATGEKVYRDKAVQWLQVLTKACEIARKSNMMLEWYNIRRFSGIVAYDWLYNELTPEERKAFMAPMLEYCKHLLKAGYQINGGLDIAYGNYGEQGLLWSLCIAAEHDGYDKATMDLLWKVSYENNVGCMRHREKLSAGTGLLTSICSGYCFGMYPNASYNFLHILKSSTGLDGTAFFPQMRDYADYFGWMAIANPALDTGFSEFGWGDAFHAKNDMPVSSIYTHMAQLIHFFKKSAPQRAATAQAVIERLPKKHQALRFSNYPFLPFILTGFDPAAKNPQPAEKYLSPDTAIFFPTFGLTVVRSGTGPQDTYASFKAGAKSSGHQHYDELSFIIYKNGFQALDTGTRGEQPHHWAYYPHTVAHNSLLIRMEKEPMPNYWYPSNGIKFDKSKLFNDGGQCVQLQAKNLGFTQNKDYAVSIGDATKCYSGKKCKEAVRCFVYIKPDYFVIYDRVESVQPDQQKVFLLHTQYLPECKDGVWRSSANTGALFLRTLLPAKTHTEVIGGKDKEFWTNNQNFKAPGYIYRWAPNGNNLGQYRMEISPEDQVNQTRFLHVLQAADEATPAMIPAKALTSATRDGAELKLADGRTAQVWFNRTGKPEAEVIITGTAKPVAKPAGPVVPPGTVTVPNGNFEQGISGWNLYGTDGQYPAAERKRALVPESEDVHAGHGAMRVADNLKDYRTYVVRPVDIPAGKFKTMTVKAWVKGIRGKSFRLGIMYHKYENGRLKCIGNCVKTLPVPEGWKEYSCTFNVPAEADCAFALIGAASMEMADTGEILVDDITMTGELK